MVRIRSSGAEMKTCQVHADTGASTFGNSGENGHLGPALVRFWPSSGPSREPCGASPVVESRNARMRDQSMNKHGTNFFLAFIMAIAFGACVACAQQSLLSSFQGHNAAMTKLQPALITPIMSTDPRIVQYAKFSFANSRTAAGTQTTSYGNGKEIGIIGGNRYEFDVVPPPYIQHNSKALDGFGDMSTLVKYRIASGNADHGNFIVTAILGHNFATGSFKNGATPD